MIEAVSLETLRELVRQWQRKAESYDKSSQKAGLSERNRAAIRAMGRERADAADELLLFIHATENVIVIPDDGTSITITIQQNADDVSGTMIGYTEDDRGTH